MVFDATTSFAKLDDNQSRLMTSAIQYFQGELDRIESKVKAVLKSNENLNGT
jgi:hypothetical protein